LSIRQAERLGDYLVAEGGERRSISAMLDVSTVNRISRYLMMRLTRCDDEDDTGTKSIAIARLLKVLSSAHQIEYRNSYLPIINKYKY
jgi:hypothetical protein